MEAGGVCDCVAVRVRVTLLDALRDRVVLIEGLRVRVGVWEPVGERVPLRVAVWVAGGEMDGVEECVAEAEAEADALGDGDGDAVGVECGLRLLVLIATAERVGDGVWVGDPVGVEVSLDGPLGVAVVAAVDERVSLTVLGGEGAAVVDQLAEEEAEEDALDEAVDVGVEWGVRLLDFVAIEERDGDVGKESEADRDPVGVVLVLVLGLVVAVGAAVRVPADVMLAVDDPLSVPLGKRVGVGDGERRLATLRLRMVALATPASLASHV